MQHYLAIAVVALSGLSLLAALALLWVAWQRHQSTRAELAEQDGRLRDLLERHGLSEASSGDLRGQIGSRTEELRRLAAELSRRTRKTLIPEWLFEALTFVEACRKWETEVAQTGAQVPSKEVVAGIAARANEQIGNALASHLARNAWHAMTGECSNAVELMLKNTDLYIDKEQRNYGLQEALRGVVAAARMRLIAPRPNDRYTELSGVTRTVRSVICRGLSFAEDAPLNAGRVICDPILEESTY